MAQWWDEWEMYILVLASLGAQCFLVLFAGVRKFYISPWLQFSFRLAHIGSDALAIFALATLFNRQRSGPRCSYAPGSRELELLLAPILLMHLGGQIVITTYKIEDNEQSTRYILTSLSKVTVALYVSYKTWSSDNKRLLAAMVSLFTLVIIKCFQKALYLKSSSFNALREANSSEVNVMRGREEEGLDRFVQEAKDIINSAIPRGTPVSLSSPPYQSLLDLPCSYSDHITMVRNFWSHELEFAFEAIEGALCAMTRILYTRDDDGILNIAFTKATARGIFRLGTSALAQATLFAASLILVTAGYQEGYVYAKFAIVVFGWTSGVELLYAFVQSKFRDKFSGRILQRSLIGLLAHNRRHSTLRSIARWLRCKDLFDSFGCAEPSYSCKEITELVRLHVKTGWIEYITDPYSYRMFNDSRGEWTLARNGYLRQLGWIIRGTLDESIVLWHLATDLYIHHTLTSPGDHLSARRCKEMSNYMVHLLSDNPEMLMPGSRKGLLATAYKELEAILEGETAALRNEKELARRLFEKCELANQDTAPLIGGAWAIAQSLLSVDETKIWELIQGVWVEMLCFSASRCRGYLHAEALGTGVEYLSYVWVLLAHTGMETFPEKLQRRFCDSDVSWGYGLAREIEKRGDASPLAAQSEGTVDIILEP